MFHRHFKNKSLPYDLKLLFPVLFLTGIGIIMVYSASSALAVEKFGNAYYFVKRQALFTLSGLAVLLICKHFNHQLLRRLVYPLLVVALLLLIAVQIPGIGYSAGGATRWLRFGLISFQPSEFARFAMIVYLAYSLSKKQEQIKEFSIGFMPHVVVLGIFTILIMMQPDFGSSVILATITWMMMFVGGVRTKHLALPLAGILPVAYWVMSTAEYRMKRLMTFLNPWESPRGEGYQIIHSLMAFGTGGLWGTGLGKGYQKLFYLPEPHTDFIFSVVGEELGLAGVLLILGTYAIILRQGITIARNTRDRFGSLMAMGVTMAIGLQVCINMGVALGLLPTKGLTLPFLSYGGTSLLLNMASIGILMNIGASESQ